MTETGLASKWRSEAAKVISNEAAVTYSVCADELEVRDADRLSRLEQSVKALPAMLIEDRNRQAERGTIVAWVDREAVLKLLREILSLRK